MLIIKELKYNIRHLINRKEFYFTVIGILLINLIHIFMVIYHNYNSQFFYEMGYKGEYLSILYNIDVNIGMIVVVVFPILCSTMFSDASWGERDKKIDNIYFSRLNEKKLIITRFFLIFVLIFFIVFLGFLMNYVVLVAIYGSGNALTFFNDLGFNLISSNALFLDNLRLWNPVLFIVFISAHVSLLISLLSLLSYSCSFFLKQRILIYIIPFMIMVGEEILLSLFNLENFSIIAQLQPLGTFSLWESLILYFVLFISSLIILLFQFRRKDFL